MLAISMGVSPDASPVVGSDRRIKISRSIGMVDCRSEQGVGAPANFVPPNRGRPER